MTQAPAESARHTVQPPFVISDFRLPPLTERDLSHLWEGQRFPAEALVSRDGVRLRVVYRGRRSGGPGPDFRDAIIAAPHGLLQGDVELHVRSSDFRRHGHDRDAAYDGVVLHVVFSDDEGAGTALASGRLTPVVALADWLEGRAQEMRRWLERPLQWQEPCFSAVGRMGGDAAGAALERLGDMRFRGKTAAFATRLRSQDVDELLWEGLLEALGYGGDREAFRLLARRLPWAQLSVRLSPLPGRERPALAMRLLAEANAEVDHQALRCSVRPGNRPQRRLQGAARLAARFAEEGIFGTIQPLLVGAPEEALKALTAVLMVPGSVGVGRAREMLMNIVLPCFAAVGPKSRTRAAEMLYRRLPIPARYGAVRHLHQALGSDVPVNARRQQGMLYLLKQYCTQGGCGHCPLS